MRQGQLDQCGALQPRVAVLSDAARDALISTGVFSRAEAGA